MQPVRRDDVDRFNAELDARQVVDTLQTLAVDPRWSNEGLFAFLEGLRRLARLDTRQRVAVPKIEVGM